MNSPGRASRLRRWSANASTSARARSGSVRMNAAIVFSALKTKCGSICACSAVVVAVVQLGQLQLRGELVAERLERLDGGLVERRAGGREGDDCAGRRRRSAAAARRPRRRAGRRGACTRCGARAARAAGAPRASAS